MFGTFSHKDCKFHPETIKLFEEIRALQMCQIMKNPDPDDAPNPMDDAFSNAAEDEATDPLIEEIHAIRLKLREKTKDMNAEERTNYINRSVAPVLKKYGIKSVSRLVGRKAKEVQEKNG